MHLSSTLERTGFALAELGIVRRLRTRYSIIMGWASGHITKLQQGETVSFRPRGGSMTGRIESGQLCTVAPIDISTLRIGDIVLCRVHGSEYIHLIKAIQNGRFQIGNNRGGINGWIGSDSIFGKCVSIEA